MSRSLKILLALEVVLGLVWSVARLGPDGAGRGVLALFFFLSCLQLALILIGSVLVWREGGRWGSWLWLLAVPFLFFLVPGLLWRLRGGPLLADSEAVARVWVGLVATAVLACLVFAHRLAPLLPRFTLRSRLFNGVVLGLQALVFVGWVFLVILARDALPKDSSGIFVGAVVAYALVTAASSLVPLLFSWIALRQRRETRCRALHWSQLVLALLPWGILVLPPILAWLGRR